VFPLTTKPGTTGRPTSGGTLSFEEAIDWLDSRGGLWSTRASRTAVQVIVTLRGQQVRTPIRHLHAEDVRRALVQAVQRIRAKLAS
jgi:hypothetical protein